MEEERERFIKEGEEKLLVQEGYLVAQSGLKK